MGRVLARYAACVAVVAVSACNAAFGLDEATVRDAYQPTGPVQQVVAHTVGPPLVTSIPTTAAGHALVVAAVIGTFAVHIDSVADDAGNMWTRALDGVEGMGARVEIWYVLGARPVNQVTVTVIRDIAISLMEWDGLAGPGTAVATHAEPATQSTMVSSGVINVSTTELAIGIAGCATNTPATLATPEFTALPLLDTSAIGSTGNAAFATITQGSHEASWTLPNAVSCTSGIIAIPLSGQ